MGDGAEFLRAELLFRPSAHGLPSYRLRGATAPAGHSNRRARGEVPVTAKCWTKAPTAPSCSALSTTTHQVFYTHTKIAFRSAAPSLIPTNIFTSIPWRTAILFLSPHSPQGTPRSKCPALRRQTTNKLTAGNWFRLVRPNSFVSKPFKC